MNIQRITEKRIYSRENLTRDVGQSVSFFCLQRAKLSDKENRRS